jgi:hypothetical protein
MNGMGMGVMQNVQNMQHRYQGERERERERESERDVTRERERERKREREREREREMETGRTRERGGVRGGDIGGYRRDNHGQKVQGPSKRNVEINKQIAVCEHSRDLCVLIAENAAEFNPDQMTSIPPAKHTGRPDRRICSKVLKG